MMRKMPIILTVLISVSTILYIAPVLFVSFVEFEPPVFSMGEWETELRFLYLFFSLWVSGVLSVYFISESKNEG